MCSKAFVKKVNLDVIQKMYAADLFSVIILLQIGSSFATKDESESDYFLNIYDTYDCCLFKNIPKLLRWIFWKIWSSKWLIQERNQMQVCDEAKLKDLIKVVIAGVLLLPTWN